VAVMAEFYHISQPLYWYHWVSYVISHTGPMDVLEDKLGFTPNLNFNAGLIAAGEYQIESTVLGNYASLEDPLRSASIVNDSHTVNESV